MSLFISIYKLETSCEIELGEFFFLKYFFLLYPPFNIMLLYFSDTKLLA